MPPDIKRNIMANECKAALMTTCISQGSAATHLRGYDSFNSHFLHRSLVNLMVKNYGNWSMFVEVIARESWPGTFDTPCKQFLLHIGAINKSSFHCSL